MPLKKYKYGLKQKRSKWKRKKPAGYATSSTFMSKSLKQKRFNQVSTKCFYFKDNGVINNTIGGTFQFSWSPQNIITAPPTGWVDLLNLYDEFKVIAMYVKLFPANVGIEPDSSIFTVAGLLRGNVIVWNDQKAPPTPTTISSISQKINQASCRMINPRLPYNRKIFRSTGNPKWGGTTVPASSPDPWQGTINIFGQNTTTFTPPAAPVPLFYWTRCYKVVVRGRKQD